MRKISILLMFTITGSLFTGCSSNKESFIGNWSAKQASNSVDSRNELLKYNYWEIRQEKITLSISTLTDDNGKSIRVFDKSNDKSYDYQWKSDKEILVDNILYTVEVGKESLLVKNNDMEIEFERLD
jgi:hypothetical protein